MPPYKKLRAGCRQGHREFRAEVDVISRMHHKNLVSLVGFCIHTEQRLLVYEYVPNKTPEDHLHSGTYAEWPMLLQLPTVLFLILYLSS
jgi:hypothetical protein